MKGEEVKKPLLTQQLGAAAFYGLSSILIITVNKTVLTSYGLAAQTGVEWCAPDFPSCAVQCCKQCSGEFSSVHHVYTCYLSKLFGPQQGLQLQYKVDHDRSCVCN